MKDKEALIVLVCIMLGMFSIFVLCYKQYKINQAFQRIEQRINSTEEKLNKLDAVLPDKK